MSHGATVWLPFVQPFATVFLGVGAFAIAYRQWRTANNKVRVDLFKDRFQEYAETLKIMENLSENGLAVRDIKNLVVLERRSRLFFGPEYVESLSLCVKLVEDYMIALSLNDVDRAQQIRVALREEGDTLLTAFEHYASLARIR